ncbi:MAG: outer membrane protein transport protein, partial [Pirellulales bacterium]|nr:outer membrane protein transport protein [Pirellulales bacterium]
GGPTINMYRIISDPYLLTAPNDANSDGFFTYPSATGTRFHWGGGFTLGAFFKGDSGWNLGLSYQSEQWAEDITFNASDELGRPASIRTPFSLPAVVNAGAAYTAIKDTIIACDVRWTDFANAKLLGQSAGFAPNGRLNGLGWRSGWTISLGIQRKLTELFVARAGYIAMEDPIGDRASGFNLQTPLITQHVVSLGLSALLTDSTMLNIGYQHGFANEVSGPIQSQAGPVPGSLQSTRAWFDLLSIGVDARF